jgi:hypothetical protein
MESVEAATAHTRRGPSKYEFEGPRHEVGLRSPVSRASAAVQPAMLTPALPPLLTESFRLRVTFHLADPASTRGLSVEPIGVASDLARTLRCVSNF